MRIFGLLLIVGLLFAGSVARGDAGGVGVTAKLGTLGLGADVTVGVSEHLSLRGMANWFSYDDDFEFDEEWSGDSPEEGEQTADKITARLDLQSFGLVVDWHPWANEFRLSGGVILDLNEVSLSVEPGDTVEIDGTEYEVQSLDGKISFNTVGPYLGIGYGNAGDTEGHWHFAFDLGVIFHGSPDVEATATATDPTLQSALNAALGQEIAELEDDLDGFIAYPVLSFGVSYTF